MFRDVLVTFCMKFSPERERARGFFPLSPPPPLFFLSALFSSRERNVGYNDLDFFTDFTTLEDCISAYFESCDILHLHDQSFARYNFVDLRTLCLMCILLYVVTSWTN